MTDTTTQEQQVPGQGPPVPRTSAPGQGPVDTPRAGAPAPSKDLPQYKLKATCFLHDRLHQEGETIYWLGRPEHYMVPMNPAARQKFKEAGNPQYADPVGALPIAPDPQAQT